MDEIDTFDEDKQKCRAERNSILDHISDPGLIAIDKLFCDADALSRENYAKTNRYRLILVACGVLITFFFISYGEVDNNIIISTTCLAIVIFLIALKTYFDRKKSHKMHLQYRVFAESLRAQFFVNYTGIDLNVAELLPWVVKKDLPWISERLTKLPKVESTTPEAMVLFCQNQIIYHSKVVDSDSFFNRAYNFLSNLALIITIIAYFAAFAFDLYLITVSPSGLDLKSIYFNIKMVLGLMTIITLLANNFFGKMSLKVRVEEHERRIKLYEEKSMDIMTNINDKKAEEIFIDLVHEFLIENSTWYVYESQNKLGFII